MSHALRKRLFLNNSSRINAVAEAGFGFPFHRTVPSCLRVAAWVRDGSRWPVRALLSSRKQSRPRRRRPTLPPHPVCNNIFLFNISVSVPLRSHISHPFFLVFLSCFSLVFLSWITQEDSMTVPDWGEHFFAVKKVSKYFKWLGQLVLFNMSVSISAPLCSDLSHPQILVFLSWITQRRGAMVPD